MAKKTIKVTDNLVEKIYEVPCSDTSIVLNSVVSAIPSTWTETTLEQHNAGIVSCQSGKILRIFCP